MVEWKEKLAIIGIVCLLFFGIPIRVNKDSLDREELFLQFMIKFNKTYRRHTEEYDRRLAAFQKQLILIEELNNKRTSNSSAFYGITRFSDMTPEEFRHRHLKNKIREHFHNRSRHHSHEHDDDSKEITRLKRAAVSSVLLKVDWREKNVVTKVYNQKACGACWAFSTIETVESMSAIKTNVLQSLSIQEAIDCSGNNNMGCDGGDICSLLDWLYTKSIKIEPEKNYPLKLTNGVCKLNNAVDGVVVSDYTCNTLINNEDMIRLILATHGPVAVAVNALTWQNYLGGIIQFHCDGSPAVLNHAVQLVGYDMTGEIPFYIARNSWGPEFGDKGYLYIAMGSNMCGVAVEVASVTV